MLCCVTWERFRCCSTWGLVSVDQVVTGQIHRGVMHRVDEVGLHHGVVGVLHRIGRVYHVDLERARDNQRIRLAATTGTLFQWTPSTRQPSGWRLWYLHFEIVADVATVEFGADQLELPVEESLRVPVLVADEVQDLLVVGHAVHTCSAKLHSESSQRSKTRKCNTRKTGWRCV